MAHLDKSVYFAVLVLCWSSLQSASVSTVGQVDEPDALDEVSLLQASTIRKPSSKILEAAAASESIRKVNTIMEQMQVAWAEQGFWSRNKSGVPDGCGLATPAEMQMPILMWQEKNPGVRGYCFFSNVAYWFPTEDYVNEGSIVEDYTWNKYWKYGYYGTQVDEPTEWTPEKESGPGVLCESYGAVNGPEVKLTYDDGVSFTWNHVRNCIDFVDDPYCYSLGWLKGQLDPSVMGNTTALKIKGKSECERLQDEFHFIEEEVTVGRHVMSTPVYFKKAWCSLTGGCPGLTRRLHAEHVYTKCLIGAASGEYAIPEMSYCYHKGCVLEGNRIGHSSECMYEEDND